MSIAEGGDGGDRVTNPEKYIARLFLAVGLVLGSLMTLFVWTLGDVASAEPRLKQITATNGTIITLQGQKATCTVTDMTHCWQTGRWPSLNWVLTKEEIVVWRTRGPGDPTGPLLTARRNP